MEFTADIIEQIEQAQAEADGIVIPGRDRPLDFHWRVPKAAAAAAGWQGSGDGRYDDAARSMMAAAVLAGRGGEWVSYSRRREFYRPVRRYQGTAYSYDRIVDIVDELLALGLIEEERAKPGDHRRTGRQSRFKATDNLLAAFAGVGFEYCVRETLRMRDERGDSVDYRDTAQTIAMRRDLEILNKAMARTRVELPGEGVVIEGSLLTVDGAVVRMTDAPVFYRVFSRGKWNMGGRIYWWGQNLPASRRADLLIDGEAVVELDYQSLHPRMLYAKRGRTLDFDPYDLPNVDRSISKRALLVALNARTLSQAVAALLKSSSRDGTAWPLDWAQTRAVVDAVIAKNPVIAQDIGADVGISLMHDDAELAMRVVKACNRIGIVCLPIHDSFIVQARFEGELREIMDEEIQRYETRARQAYEASKRAAETVIENSVVTHCNIDVIRPDIPHKGCRGVGGVGEGSETEVSGRGRRGSDEDYVEVIDCRTRPSYDQAESERRQKAFERGETKKLSRVPGELENLLWPLYGRSVGKVLFEMYRDERSSWENFNNAWMGRFVPTEDPWYAQERKKRLAKKHRSQVSRDRYSSPSTMQ